MTKSELRTKIWAYARQEILAGRDQGTSLIKRHAEIRALSYSELRRLHHAIFSC